ncbi:MAG TPA: indole-3-glycerol-phosphate synthase [Candidatus Bathyarchaeota archaeon]|nr:indole-3-glycerol-phosphate synthase [Candidatus Bathyarchaeota archaeon]
MPDFLDILANDAIRSIEEGYYEVATSSVAPSLSLKESILKCERAPIISEVKFASPSMGTIRRDRDLKRIVKDMEEGGAAGISVLTEPKHFNGHINFIAEIRGQVDIPILMKDIVLSRKQIDAASRVGADAVLLIQALFDRGYCEMEMQSMIDYAHFKGLEVLLEVHTKKELRLALGMDADMIGINNRDLKTLKVDLKVTSLLLEKYHDFRGKVIVSESGINSPEDIRFLRRCGARAFLVGTSIMKASNVREKVKELVEAL